MNKSISRPKEMIKFLALGSGVVALSLLAPVLPARLFKVYLRQKKFQRNRFLQDLRRLQDRELIDFRENSHGSIKITLRRRGKQVALTYALDDLRIKKPAIWDGKWRLVIFDIPNFQKRARDALHMQLENLGFYSLQKSVFTYPYSCEDQIDFIGKIFGVREYILFATICDFEGEEKLKHFFGL